MIISIFHELFIIFMLIFCHISKKTIYSCRQSPKYYNFWFCYLSNYLCAVLFILKVLMYNLASSRLYQATFLHICGSNVVILFLNHSKHYQSQIKLKLLIYSYRKSNLLGEIYILEDKVIIQNSSQEETSAYNVNHSDCNFEQEFINLILYMAKELKNAGVLVYFLHFCHLIATGTFPMRHIGFLLLLDVVNFISLKNTVYFMELWNFAALVMNQWKVNFWGWWEG